MYIFLLYVRWDRESGLEFHKDEWRIKHGGRGGINFNNSFHEKREDIVKKRYEVLQKFVDLQKEFTRLAGRPPTPDEMNVGTLESLIDILKEASGEVPTPRASNLNPLDDDIPF